MSGRERARPWWRDPAPPVPGIGAPQAEIDAFFERTGWSWPPELLEPNVHVGLLELDAGAWRDRGYFVPLSVPDCAGLEIDGMDYSMPVVEGTRVTFIATLVNPRWCWITVTGTISTPVKRNTP